ncbi:hypothetical protein CC85DRAFT_286620 [Cutaneotrichosporon oleaginosum]|uniref:Uncharacterized protein n=1 Tax=Cutaneotrichosporon oleaginosum TaxID=879819 RepID=A0A0J0XJN6_9TREE|nr:uncharacterized protein CC85DRAFT_286620 [Cutaneotrichosporon oleaginosum]KLT41303.1 hypothetical protein CC85DRAFT_286620 [Cutaneotrichosporon oleaginosum]TXT14053.1 hypothetical protein COLE_00246 [Cutaneotrichosporon oleaginosum]
MLGARSTGSTVLQTGLAGRSGNKFQTCTRIQGIGAQLGNGDNGGDRLQASLEDRGHAGGIMDPGAM